MSSSELNYRDKLMLNWNEIDTVLLDMDGTLLDLAYDNHFWLEHIPRAYADHHGIEPEIAKQQLIQTMESVKGQLEWYCIDHWSDVLGFDVGYHVQATRSQVAARPFALEFLNFLREQSKHVLMVTNAHTVVLDNKMEEVNLRPYFDSLISSHHYASPKEDLAFWSRLVQDFPMDTTRTLLIDDNEQVLAAAQRFGIKHLVTLKQPDSSLAPRTCSNYAAITHFDEILI